MILVEHVGELKPRSSTTTHGEVVNVKPTHRRFHRDELAGDEAELVLPVQ